MHLAVSLPNLASKVRTFCSSVGQKEPQRETHISQEGQGDARRHSSLRSTLDVYPSRSHHRNKRLRTPECPLVLSAGGTQTAA